jgi:hypothetical protein
MHLRGPMNVSQLAVYQIPGEALKMRKRASVPFYNRRRSLEHRTMSSGDTNASSRHLHDILVLDKRV